MEARRFLLLVIEPIREMEEGGKTSLQRGEWKASKLRGWLHLSFAVFICVDPDSQSYLLGGQQDLLPPLLGKLVGSSPRIGSFQALQCSLLLPLMKEAGEASLFLLHLPP